MSVAAVRPGTVVVGVDGSEPSDRAVVWATNQAALEGRAVTLVHGVGFDAVGWHGVATDHGQPVLDSLREVGERVLEHAVSTAEWTAPQVEITTVLPVTDPRLALLEAAERAALLVVGSRGRGPLAELVLGSVSQALTRRPPCPVVVVGGPTTGQHLGGVLVGVDGDGTSAAALELAFRHASLRGLPLTVMHCFLELRGTTTDAWQVPFDTPGLEAQRLTLDETVAGMRQRFPDVDVTLTIGLGLVDDCLVHAARDMELVVVGAHPIRSLVGILTDHHHGRTVADRAPCVVAVVPEAP